MTDLQVRPADQSPDDTQPCDVGGSPTPLPAKPGATPNARALVVESSQTPANVATTPNLVPLASDLLDPGHTAGDTQTVAAGVEPSHPDPPNPAPTPTARSWCPGEPSAATSPTRNGAHPRSAGGGISSTPAMEGAPSIAEAPGSNFPEPAIHPNPDTQVAADGWLELRVWAEMYFDAQQTKQAQQNRARRGGVDPALYDAGIEALETAENVIQRQAILSYRRHVPATIRSWQKDTRGLGELLMARFIGHLGHPVWASPHHWEGTGSKRVLVADEPYARTVGQLWQYAGHGRPGRAKKGATFDDLAALGSPQLKMLLHLNAEAIVKAGIRKNDADAPAGFDPDTRHAISTFGQVYYDRRVETLGKLHSVACVRCGPSGKPAQPGSPWSPGHQQGDALRIVGKEILRDLWRVAR